MRYFMIADDGERYGPADVATLVQWALEGRLVGHHWLEEEGTGRRLQAFQIPDLGFGQSGTVAYPRGQQQAQDFTRDLTLAWICGVFSFIPCCFLIPVPIAGIYACHRIETKGGKAVGPKVLNGIGLLFQAIALFTGLPTRLIFGGLFS